MQDLDRLLDGSDYTMFVVTVQHDNRRAGCLVGFVTQASIDPPRMLVCLSVANHTYDVAREADVLAVHLLAADQLDLAALFGSTTGDEIDKFERCLWQPGREEVLLLTDSLGWMVGRIRERIPLGDHVGFLLEPIEVHRPSDEALLTFRRVQGLSPGHPV